MNTWKSQIPIGEAALAALEGVEEDRLDIALDDEHLEVLEEGRRAR